MIKTKVAFLEGQLFSSQSELFENFSNSSSLPKFYFFDILCIFSDVLLVEQLF